MNQTGMPSNESSLRPIETEAAQIVDEADSMNKGSGLKLIGFALAAVVVVGVGVAMLGNLDKRQSFTDAGAKVSALNENGFEAFWNCALVNMNQAQLKSADDLAAQLEKRAERFGHAYAGSLKKCGATLDSLERDLSTLSVPEALRPQSQAMETAVGTMRHALQDLVATAGAPSPQYDPSTLKPAITKLAGGWQEFKQSHAAFTEALSKHL